MPDVVNPRHPDSALVDERVIRRVLSRSLREGDSASERLARPGWMVTVSCRNSRLVVTLSANVAAPPAGLRIRRYSRSRVGEEREVVRAASVGGRVGWTVSVAPTAVDGLVAAILRRVSAWETLLAEGQEIPATFLRGEWNAPTPTTRSTWPPDP